MCCVNLLIFRNIILLLIKNDMSLDCRRTCDVFAVKSRVWSFIEGVGIEMFYFLFFLSLPMCQKLYCINQRISHSKNNGAPFGVHRCLHKVYSSRFACKLINLLKIFIYCCTKGYVPVCFQKVNYSVVG